MNSLSWVFAIAFAVCAFLKPIFLCSSFLSSVNTSFFALL